MDTNSSQLVLTRDSLLQRSAQCFVALPWLGDGGVYLRVISGQEMVSCLGQIDDDSLSTRQKDILFEALLIRYSACDADGNEVFSPGDEQIIVNMDRNVFRALSSAAMEINALSEKAADDLKKSTAETPGSDFGTGSPSHSA